MDEGWMPMQMDPLIDRVTYVGKARQGRRIAHVTT